MVEPFTGFFLTEDIAFSEMKIVNATTTEMDSGAFRQRKIRRGNGLLLADQFPGREAFVGMKTQIQSMLGIHENNGILEGKNNRLFQKYSVGDLDDNCQGIGAFAEKYEVPTEILLIPTKAAVYPEDLPKDVPMPDEVQIAREIAEKSGCPTTFLLEDFLAHKAEQLYYDTDHH